jgi:aminopeptidase N
MRPEFVGDVEQLTSATRYIIEASVDLDLESQEARIEGVARIRFTNPLPEPLEDLVLMLWPNDDQYQSAMTAGPVLIGAEALGGEMNRGGIAMRVALPEPLAPGEALDASVPFSVQVDGPMRPESPKRFTITEDVLLAPTFYPLIPRLVGGEWQVLPAPPGGDTTNSDVAFYEVHLTTPAELALAASGVEVGQAENPDGTVTTSFATGPVRDFAFALGPLQLTERTVEGVLLRAWVLPQHAGDARGMLEAAAAQVRALTQAIGPYPYAELDLVDAPEAYGGIEYPGLVFIGTLGTFAMVEPVVHEVGHQWFYGVVGNDQLLDPWLDEGAATFTEILYYESAFGVQRGTTALEALRQVVEIEPEVAEMPVGLPVSEFRDEYEYAVVAYYKGALFFEALRRELGPDLFGDFLHAYYQEYRYEVATPEGFQNAAEETCGCDLDALFDLWVYEGGPLPGP